METHDSCRVNEDLRLHDDESYLAKRKQNNKSFTILTNAKRKLKMLTNKNKKKKNNEQDSSHWLVLFGRPQGDINLYLLL